MNKTEIDVMWSRALREAIEGGEEFTRYRFAAMLTSAEREACAKVADEYANGLERNYSENIADAIRARGEAK
jgi:hypothetical protein